MHYNPPLRWQKKWVNTLIKPCCVSHGVKSNNDWMQEQQIQQKPFSYNKSWNAKHNMPPKIMNAACKLGFCCLRLNLASHIDIGVLTPVLVNDHRSIFTVRSALLLNSFLQLSYINGTPVLWFVKADDYGVMGSIVRQLVSSMKARSFTVFGMRNSLVFLFSCAQWKNIGL